MGHPLKARLEPLAAEDEPTRRRQEQPWVRIDRQYQFEDDRSAPPTGESSRSRQVMGPISSLHQVAGDANLPLLNARKPGK